MKQLTKAQVLEMVNSGTNFTILVVDPQAPKYGVSPAYFISFGESNYGPHDFDGDLEIPGRSFDFKAADDKNLPDDDTEMTVFLINKEISKTSAIYLVKRSTKRPGNPDLLTDMWWFGPSLSPSNEIHHLTKDGKTSLCGSDGSRIHTRYASLIPDKGRWCKECQKLYRVKE